MKYLKIFEEFVNKIILYHGTNADFDKFDKSKLGESEQGTSLLGHGIYLTDNEEIAKFYSINKIKNAKYIDKWVPTHFGEYGAVYIDGAYKLAEKEVVIMKYEFTGNILDAETYIIEDELIKLLKELSDDEFVINGLNYLFSFLREKGNKKRIKNYRGELLYIFGQLYNGNMEVINKVAEYFQNKGYDGIKYQSGDFEKIKSYNYVIYNENSLKRVY